MKHSDSAIERVGLGPESWLTNIQDVRPGVGCHVSSLLPAGFETYLRLFHPFTEWACPGRRTWRELAEEAGARFHSELSIRALTPALEIGRERDRFRYQVAEGTLEPVVSGALHSCIRRMTADKSTLYYYGLAAVVRGEDPLLFHGPHSKIVEVHASATEIYRGIAGPEYVWRRCSRRRDAAGDDPSGGRLRLMSCGGGQAIARAGRGRL